MDNDFNYIKPNKCEIGRPSATECATYFDDTKYLWSQEKYKNWFKSNILTQSLKDVYDLTIASNPWYQTDYSMFTKELFKIPEFSLFWKENEENRLLSMEEELILGKVYDRVMEKTTVDANGNIDIAKGYLSLADKRVNTMKWILERRNKKFQFANTPEDVVKEPNVVIMPKKEG